jgi:hypothetical protein
MVAFGIDWYIIGCYRFPIWWIGKQPWCLIFTINYIFPCTGKNRVVFTLKKTINGKLNLVNGRLVNSSWELAHLKLAIHFLINTIVWWPGGACSPLRISPHSTHVIRQCTVVMYN